jgi:hypothetical protein
MVANVEASFQFSRSVGAPPFGGPLRMTPVLCGY